MPIKYFVTFSLSRANVAVIVLFCGLGAGMLEDVCNGNRSLRVNMFN